ncbi:MAG: hypothetical protein ACT4N4_01880 [Rhodospirillales bacterium]
MTADFGYRRFHPVSTAWSVLWAYKCERRQISDLAALFFGCGERIWLIPNSRKLVIPGPATNETFPLGRTSRRHARALGDNRAVLRLRGVIVFNFGACLYATAQGAVFAYLVLFARDVLAASPGIASLCLGMRIQLRRPDAWRGASSAT